MVVAQEGALFLDLELLVPGGPLDQLVALLGEGLAHGQTLHVHRALLPDGSPLVNDEDPAHADAYQAAVWNAALAARQAAGERPLVFALAAGRRRTMTALVTTAFQMLARTQDACVDVRVSDRRVEGAKGFYFPEQRRQRLAVGRDTVEANLVQVALVEARLPRLRDLIPEARLATYGGALAAAQSAIDEARLPRLLIDLPAGKALVDGKLTEGHARALLALSTQKAQASAMQIVINLSLSVRQTEELIRKLAGQKPIKAKKPTQSADVHDVEKRLQHSLGTKVALKHGKKGGTVTIYYYSDEELDALLGKLT